MTDKEHAEYQADMRERYAKAHVQGNESMTKRFKEVYESVRGATMTFDGYEAIEAARIKAVGLIIAAEIGRGKFP